MVWDRHCKRSMWLRHSHKEKLFKWGTAVSKRSAYQSTKSHWRANLRRYWVVAYAYIFIYICIGISNSPSRCWISRGSSWGKDWQLALSLLRNAVDELQQVGFVTSCSLDIKAFMPMILTQDGPYQLYMSLKTPVMMAITPVAYSFLRNLVFSMVKVGKTWQNHRDDLLRWIGWAFWPWKTPGCPKDSADVQW